LVASHDLPQRFAAIRMQSRAPLPSKFDSLIDDLLSADERPASLPRANPVSFNSLQATWQLLPSARDASAETPIRHHRYDHEGEGAEDTGAEPLLDPNRILSELGLGTNSTEEDVVALRREFALRNHPDRVRPELRALATQRMMIANDLMDRYVARLRRPGR
jgi:hypothetical protein